MKKEQLFNIPKSKIMYNAQGEPEFILVPIKQPKVYAISDNEILTEIKNLRAELTERYNAETSSAVA